MTDSRNAHFPGGPSLSRVESLLGLVLDGRFELQEVVGRGGMGVVFAARQLSVERRVAVKVLRDDQGTPAERFIREARIIAQISHPHVVALIDAGHIEELGILYYAMELLEGASLHEVLGRGRLHPNLVIEFAMQICSALAEAHARAVVHRDLKPANMIVTLGADGSLQLKVLDFGIALTAADARLTGTGVLCGTPNYMAPEQARGEQFTPAMDLYSLGICLYQMLSGALPFTGGSPLDVVLKHVTQPAPTLRRQADAGLVPNGLAALVEELVAKAPQDRPASAAAVRQRLLGIRNEQGWGPVAVEPPTLDALQQLVRPPLSEEEPAAVPPDWRCDEAATTPALQVPRRSDTAEASAELPLRSGGGWDAFHATPSEAPSDAPGLVLGPVTGEFMSVPDDVPDNSATQAVSRPVAPSVVAARRGVSARAFAPEELVPDLPARPTPEPVRPEPRSGGVRTALGFVVVALVAFALVAAVLALLPGREADQATPAAPPPEQTAPPEPARARSTPKKKAKPKPKPEVIEVFEDAPDDPADRPPIIIEEER